ncbi:MAG: TonB-dependent receptor, partial [Flavobacteriales bacterium]
GEKLHLFGGEIESKTYRINSTLHKKINSRHKLIAGVKYNLNNYDYFQVSKETAQEQVLADFDENIATLRSFIGWRFRLNEDITLVSGLHNMNVLYNKKHTIEPRAAIRWDVNSTNSLSLGYGMHSNMEKAHNYFARIYNEDGTWSRPNENLDLLKAHHYVLGYEKQIGNKMMAKLEMYYQDLYNLPVENNDTSYYSTINEGIDYNYVELVNEGKGKNYGVEFTLERFFNNNYYWMFNTSIFQSKYTALDGVERNTKFNSNYVVNLMGGKDFVNLGKKKNQVLAVNVKAFFGGGEKIIPLKRDENGNLDVDPDNNQYYDYSKAYDNSIEDLYRIDLAVSYKWNKPKTTHELFFDIYDLTGVQGKLQEYYDTSEDNNVGYNTQFGLFPNMMYRLYF